MSSSRMRQLHSKTHSLRAGMRLRRGHEAHVTRLLATRSEFGFSSEADYRAWSARACGSAFNRYVLPLLFDGYGLLRADRVEEVALRADLRAYRDMASGLRMHPFARVGCRWLFAVI